MSHKHIIIIGGGVAGLAAGCYARASGFRTTIVEHNSTLGGVCTAWSFGPYTADGCIQWLVGGPFRHLYRELKIMPRISTRPLEVFATHRDLASGSSVEVTQDLEAFGRKLLEISPEDTEEIRRLLNGSVSVSSISPPIDTPAEFMTVRESLDRVWEMRSQIATVAHFRKPVGVWARENLRHPVLQRLFIQLFPAETPALFLLFTLGYLSRGWLSRPEGGTLAFRDALIESYRSLGGEVRLDATVDEVLVEGERARGVRLGDGTVLDADFVISTASTPETVLRLLGGRYGAPELQERLDTWKLFDPIVLASYGVSCPLEGVPSTLLLDGIKPLVVGGHANDCLRVRVYNDEPLMAPAGHTVVQATVSTTYDHWARCGSAYSAEKNATAERIFALLEKHLPIPEGSLRAFDLATPLTFWNKARSWRGAYEGFQPNTEAFFGHVKRTVPGLRDLYLAGQWVEPGGGVPTALMSGRQVVQLICAGEGRKFVLPRDVPENLADAGAPLTSGRSG